jgi:hypothetical protein
MAWPAKKSALPAADLADARAAVGMPQGKRLSILNMAKNAPNSAKRRRPKPGAENRI